MPELAKPLGYAGLDIHGLDDELEVHLADADEIACLRNAAPRSTVEALFATSPSGEDPARPHALRGSLQNLGSGAKTLQARSHPLDLGTEHLVHKAISASATLRVGTHSGAVWPRLGWGATIRPRRICGDAGASPSGPLVPTLVAASAAEGCGGISACDPG